MLYIDFKREGDGLKKISFLTFQKIVKNRKKCISLKTSEKWSNDERMPLIVILGQNKHNNSIKKKIKTFFFDF